MPSRVRLGHALRGGDDAAIEQALRVARGEEPLSARPPLDVEAVRRTETRLGVDPTTRPIYAYVGDLHPALGTVGIVVRRTWSSRACQGVTRCDSGGLGGRRGAFSALSDADAADALVSLSWFDAATSWEQAFAVEVGSSYARGAEGYVAGDEPDVTRWGEDDVRRVAFEERPRERDRRLWTWEARLASGPDPDEVVALVVSEGALKRLVATAPALPEHVAVIAGSAGPSGAEFSAPRVRSLLRGNP